MEIKDPYLCVEISESQFVRIKNQLRKELNFMGFENLKELPNPHISISYLLGKMNKADLDLLANEIAEGPFEMKVNGIKLIDSSFYQGTVISLSLEHSDDFVYLQEFVKESILGEDEIVVKDDFPGGFKAHISLFLINELNDEEKELISEYLEIALTNIGVKVKGEKFSISDCNREKIIEKSFI